VIRPSSMNASTDVTAYRLSHSSTFLAFSGQYDTWSGSPEPFVAGPCKTRRELVGVPTASLFQSRTVGVPTASPDCLNACLLLLLSGCGSATKRLEVSSDGEPIFPGQVAGVVVDHLRHGSAGEIAI